MKLLRSRWNETFLDEVCWVPNGQFDDQVDTFVYALNELALGSTFTLDNIGRSRSPKLILIKMLWQGLQLIGGHLCDGMHGAVFVPHKIELSCI